MINTENNRIRPLSLLLLLVVSISSFSQETDLSEEFEVWLVTDEPALPPGGYDSLYSFIGDSLKYPEEAQSLGLSGRVFVAFVIDPGGILRGAEILKGIGGGCDEEVLRVLSLVPPWTPAKIDNKNVAQRITIAVNFKVDSSAIAKEEKLRGLLPVLPTNLRIQKPKVDLHPEFPGGDAEMEKFVKRNKREIKTALPLNNSHNCVVLNFEVNLAGNIVDINVEKSLGPEYDQEAIRLFKIMPKWLPAMKNKKIISYRTTEEIIFGPLPKNKLMTAEQYYRYGSEYFVKEEFKRAIASFSKAIKLNPYQIDYYFNRAAVYIHTEQIQEGCNDLKNIAKLDKGALELFEYYCEK